MNFKKNIKSYDVPGVHRAKYTLISKTPSFLPLSQSTSTLLLLKNSSHYFTHHRNASNDVLWNSLIIYSFVEYSTCKNCPKCIWCFSDQWILEACLIWGKCPSYLSNHRYNLIHQYSMHCPFTQYQFCALWSVQNKI